MQDPVAPTSALRSGPRSGRFLPLLLFLLAVLVLAPLIMRYRLLHVVLSLLLLNGLYASLEPSGLAARWRWLLVAIWCLNAALWVWSSAAGDPARQLVLFTASRGLALALLAACVVATLRYVLLSSRISADTIFAAIVAYQLIALAFAVLYQAIVTIDPSSFAFPQRGSSEAAEGMLVQLIYFSFVTIATLGYGDIVPRAPLTQMLATVEATLGQFYIAVIIAWLVSAYAARRSAPSED